MKALSKKQRADLRMMFGGKCAYCGTELPERGWHADHVEPVIRGSAIIEVSAAERERTGYTHRLKPTGQVFRPEAQRVDNFYPACAPCNIFKSTFPVEFLRQEIAAQVERARKTSSNFRVAERFGLIAVTNAPVQFWFEKFNANRDGCECSMAKAAGVRCYPQCEPSHEI
jgi:hypothetical protein